MCIDAPESTTNYLSSGIVEDGAANEQTWECGFVLFFELVDTFGHFPRISAGASFSIQGSLMRSVLNFWCVWCTLCFGPENFVPFRKIDLDFGGATALIASNSSTRQQHLFRNFASGSCQADCHTNLLRFLAKLTVNLCA